jgi:hypothetical protein
MNVWRHTAATLLYGFLFRPTMLFILPGVALMIAAACFNLHTAVSFLSEFQNLHEYAFFERASAAAAAAYHQFPHIFVIGAVTMTLAVQLLGLGLLALQSKSYFEELFHLGSKRPQSMERSEKVP